MVLMVTIVRSKVYFFIVWTVFLIIFNFASIVQKSVYIYIFFILVKDIDEWNILILRYNIIMKKKSPKIDDENFQLFI